MEDISARPLPAASCPVRRGGTQRPGKVLTPLHLGGSCFHLRGLLSEAPDDKLFFVDTGYKAKGEMGRGARRGLRC